MRVALLFGMLAVAALGYASPLPGPVNISTNISREPMWLTNIAIVQKLGLLTYANHSLLDIQTMLHTSAPTMSEAVISKVITVLSCGHRADTENNNILTVIDYSLPSNKKRLWVFDLSNNRLLYHTYVSHGLRSGALYANYFSNRSNSRSSSIGTYATSQSYYGRDGVSLKLTGLDVGFNDNAENRAVVMHGGWYVNEVFIKKYGRAGRSWGCPALPLELSTDIINTIKNESLLIIYYPSERWFRQSKFLNCGFFGQKMPTTDLFKPFLQPDDPLREEILYVDYNKNNRHEENEPVVVLAADQYMILFKQPAPLERMLRRQINEKEYIVLTAAELEHIRIQPMAAHDGQPPINLQALRFVIPVMKMNRGYYLTQMTIVNIGKVTNINHNLQGLDQPYSLEVSGRKSLSLKTTHEFIRWLGL